MKVNGVEMLPAKSNADERVASVAKVERQAKPANLITTTEQGREKNLSGDSNGRAATREEIYDAAKALEETANIFNKALHFTIHEETDRVIVQVINKETQEVIREIPPEQILDILARMEKLLGIFVDERV